MKRFLATLLSALFVACMFGSGFSIQTDQKERYYADGYNGASYEGSGTETISYSTKSDEEISIAGGLPKYYNVGDYTNTCANVAGAILLGYYDKDYDELIPNFQAARVIMGRVFFSAQTQAVQNVIDDLYIKMDTNNGGNGTTTSNFRSGLQSYVSGKGRSIEYTTAISQEQLNVNVFKTAINNKQPVAVFLSKYTLVSLSGIHQESQLDEYNKLYYGGDHTVICYGIREIKYYNQNGALINEYTLLMAATGYLQDSVGYILLDNRTRLIEGYVVDIY